MKNSVAALPFVGTASHKIALNEKADTIQQVKFIG